MKILLLFLSFIILMPICCDGKEMMHKKVEIYLIESFSLKENESCQIDEATVITNRIPIVYYSDILSYDPETFTFTLSVNALKILEEMEHSVRGVPFALKVDDDLIYTGYFWPGYSSVSCDWIIIDPLKLREDHKLIVELGYPGGNNYDPLIPDKRNDHKIIHALKKDNKLK